MRPYRKERVASTIRELVSDIIARKLQDPRVDRMTTVTRVVVSADLLMAKVYLTVHGGGAPQSRTLAAITHAGGYIQRLVARELTMRQCPQLRFLIDESLDEVRRTLELMDQNVHQRNEEMIEQEQRCGPELDQDGVGGDAGSAAEAAFNAGHGGRPGAPDSGADDQTGIGCDALPDGLNHLREREPE